MITVLVEAGAALIAVGLAVLVAKALTNQSRPENESDESHNEAGGVIFIGPVPIVFGSNRRLARWMLLVALIISALLFATFLISSGVL